MYVLDGLLDHRRTNQRADRDRSRSQNRRGYTVRRGSGCRTNEVHLIPRTAAATAAITPGENSEIGPIFIVVSPSKNRKASQGSIRSFPLMFDKDRDRSPLR